MPAKWQVSILVLMLCNTDAHKIYQVPKKELSFSSIDKNNELVDMSAMANKMSSLQLSMLNKKNEENSSVPTDTEMVLQQQHLRLGNRIKKEDLNSDDVMAYSTVAVDADADAGEGSMFGEGGAIMDALYQQDPSLKPKPKAVVQKKVVKQPSKAEVEKKKKAEEDKKKAAAELKKQEENAKKEAEIKQKAIDADRAAREQKMLENFMDGDSLTQQSEQQPKTVQQIYGNYGGYENGKKKLGILQSASQNLQEQTLGETAGTIVDKAKKSIFKGLIGNMDF